jgi:hypothetical protein
LLQLLKLLLQIAVLLCGDARNLREADSHEYYEPLEIEGPMHPRSAPPRLIVRATY